MPDAVRFTLAPSAEPALEEILAELFVSWSIRAGALSVWVSEEEADEVAVRLEAAGVEVLGREVEPERDWVAEAAALQRPVAVGGLVLDPHEPPSADPGSAPPAPPPGRKGLRDGLARVDPARAPAAPVFGPRRGIRPRRRLRRGDSRARRADRRRRAGVRIRPRPGGAAGLARERPPERHRRVRVLGRASREPVARRAFRPRRREHAARRGRPAPPGARGPPPSRRPSRDGRAARGAGGRVPPAPRRRGTRFRGASPRKGSGSARSRSGRELATAGPRPRSPPAGGGAGGAPGRGGSPPQGLPGRPGAEVVVLLDGVGARAEAYLSADGREAVVQGLLPARGEPSRRVTVLLGVGELARVEWAVEKGTECGAARFVLVAAARSQRAHVAAAAARLERLRRIAAEAAKQCDRSVVPGVLGPAASRRRAGRSAAGRSSSPARAHPGSPRRSSGPRRRRGRRTRGRLRRRRGAPPRRGRRGAVRPRGPDPAPRDGRGRRARAPGRRRRFLSRFRRTRADIIPGRRSRWPSRTSRRSG